MNMEKKKKILVVDDNQSFIQLMEMSFSKEFDIIEALDGEEGLKKAIAEKPGIILIDIMMPKVSGIEMLRNLLAEPETKSIPVIVLTAYNFDSNIRTLFEQESNVKGFLQKTCDLNTLRKNIHTALKAAGG